MHCLECGGDSANLGLQPYQRSLCQGSGPGLKFAKRGRPRLGMAFEIVGLTAFVFARPVLDITGRSPEIFSSRGESRAAVVGFAVSVVVIPALAVIGIEELLGLFSGRARLGFHRVLVGTLAGLGSFQVLLLWGLGWSRALLGSVLVAVVVAVARARSFRVRSFFRLFSATAVVVLAAFVLGSAMRPFLFGSSGEASGSQGATKAPDILFVVFDELGTSVLVNGTTSVDSRLFPNFSRFEAASTWYRNALTTSTFTLYSVPAIATGQIAGSDIAKAYSPKQSLFTLLPPAYHLNVDEPLTAMCRGSRCQSVEGSELTDGSLASLAFDVWKTSVSSEANREAGFDELNASLAGNRADQIASFRANLSEKQSGPRLDFIHLEMPHEPYAFLPDGTEYLPGTGLDGYEYNHWTTDQGAEVARERHLLQTMYVDRVLGQLLDALKESGRFDDTMIVVTADHGSAYYADETFRGVTAKTLVDQVFVPLFIKLPGQSEGSISDSQVLNVDAVAAIVDYLGLTPSVELYGEPPGERETPSDWFVFDTPPFTKELTRFDFDLDQARAELWSRDAYLGLDRRDPLDAVIGMTQGADLVGRRVSSFAVGKESVGELSMPMLPAVREADANLAPRAERALGHNDAALPLYVRLSVRVGSPSMGDLDIGRTVVISLNGLVVGTTQLELDNAHSNLVGYALISPKFFDLGGNRVQLFMLDEHDQNSLQPIGVE